MNTVAQIIAENLLVFINEVKYGGEINFPSNKDIRKILLYKKWGSVSVSLYKS